MLFRENEKSPSLKTYVSALFSIPLFPFNFIPPFLPTLSIFLSLFLLLHLSPSFHLSFFLLGLPSFCNGYVTLSWFSNQIMLILSAFLFSLSPLSFIPIHHFCIFSLSLFLPQFLSQFHFALENFVLNLYLVCVTF